MLNHIQDSLSPNFPRNFPLFTQKRATESFQLTVARIISEPVCPPRSVDTACRVGLNLHEIICTKAEMWRNSLNFVVLNFERPTNPVS